MVDEASIQRTPKEKESHEAVAGIRRGIEAMLRGESRPLDDVFDDLRTKYEQIADS